MFAFGSDESCDELLVSAAVLLTCDFLSTFVLLKSVDLPESHCHWCSCDLYLCTFCRR